MALIRIVANRWQEPDEGIYEVRGPRQHCTHSRLMARVAADRAVRSVEQFGPDGPFELWRSLRDEISDDILCCGLTPSATPFTQFYGSAELDAAVLMIPLVGFLPIDDERVTGTVAAIEKELLVDGFVRRDTQHAAADTDGLPPGEGAFLACTCRLADNYSLMGRTDDARCCSSDCWPCATNLGCSPRSTTLRREGGSATLRRFSHVPLINSAREVSRTGGPSHQREKTTEAGRGSADPG